MSTVSIDVQVLRTLHDLEGVAPEWEQCYQADVAATPYASYDWIHCLTEKLLKEESLRLCIVRKEGRAIAILPLAMAKRGLLLPYTQSRWAEASYLHWAADLSWMGGGIGTRYGGIIVPEGRNLPITDTVLGSLFKEKHGFLFAKLASAPSAHPLISLADGQSAISHFTIDKMPAGGSIVIELPGSWETYRSTLSAAHKKWDRRRINAIRRAGQVRFVRLGLNPSDDLGAVAALVEDAIIVSSKSWQGNATTGIAISDGAVSDFVRTVSLRLARRGALDLSVLYLNDNPISFLWGAARWPFTTGAKTAFDPAYGELSPGVVHHEMVIHDSVERGGAFIDLGNQFTDYKLRYGKRTDELVDVTYYRYHLLSSVVRWKRRMAKIPSALRVLSGARLTVRRPAGHFAKPTSL